MSKLSITNRGWGWAAFACAIAITIKVTSCVDSSASCPTKPMTSAWASDQAYKATLIEKTCDLGGLFIDLGVNVSYAVRIDAYSPPLKRAWYATLEIDNDNDVPIAAPTVRWDGKRKLSIVSVTTTLEGSQRRNIGEDLTVDIVFSAKRPGYFLNY